MPTATQDPFYLKLSPELRDKLDAAVMSRVERVVNACQDRDDELLELHLMLDGMAQPTGSQPWPNACELESTLVREMHTTLHASLTSASTQTPYCTIDPSNTNDDVDRAEGYERFINLKFQRDGYQEAIADILYTALESRFAPLYVGYTQDRVHSFEMGYRKPEWAVDQAVTANLREEGEEYDEVLLEDETVTRNGLDFRAVLPWNFYVDPIDAPGAQLRHDCERVIERIFMTREQLELGVRDLGYDAAKVKDLVQVGPTQSSDQSHRSELNEDLGLNNAMGGDYWECYQVIGRLPYLAGDDEVPKPLRYKDFVWLCCPAKNICFKRAFSPFPLGVRPYAVFCAFPKPGFMLGNGIVSLLRDIQNEMTALQRFGINKLNLEATPMLSVPERWLLKYSKWKVAPGRLMPRVTDNPNEIHPIVWDSGTQGFIIEWMQMLDNYGSRLAASESANSLLGGKVRKATEVQFADAMMQTKFDLIQSNINRGIKDAFTIGAALVAQNPQPDQPDDARITLDDIQSNFRFIPQANADGANSQLRLQKSVMIAGIARQSMVFQQRLMSGDLGGDWELTHRQLSDAGCQDAEAIIGPKPDGPQQVGGGGDKPKVTINFKDLPPQAQMAAMQEAGLGDNQPQAPQQDGAEPQVAQMEANKDLEMQKRDHAHQVNLTILKHHGDMQKEQLKQQAAAQQKQADMAMQQQQMAQQAQQSEADRQHQTQEGAAQRETQIQQAKLRPVGTKTNGTGGNKSNGKAHAKN